MESEAQIIINGVSGLSIVGIITIILNFMIGKLSKELKDIGTNSMTKELCDTKHDHIEKTLDRGDNHFKEVDKKMEEVRDATKELGGKIALLLLKNGIAKK